MTQTLIHVCCAPCASASLSATERSEKRYATFFYNPNIQPEQEYRLRLENFLSFAEDREIDVFVGSYDPTAWQTALEGSGGVYPLIEGTEEYDENLRLRKIRCRRCYRHRFARLAKEAVERGFDSIATTLSISPYQFIDEMSAIMQQQAEAQGIESAFQDYRTLYPESVTLSRELGMYRQKYCGCSYSKAEAETEKAARKAIRKQKGTTEPQNRKTGTYDTTT